MPQSDPDLSDQQCLEIWRRWQQRPTIESLAKEFNVSKEVIRNIIRKMYPNDATTWK